MRDQAQHGIPREGRGGGWTHGVHSWCTAPRTKREEGRAGDEATNSKQRERMGPMHAGAATSSSTASTCDQCGVVSCEPRQFKRRQAIVGSVQTIAWHWRWEMKQPSIASARPAALLRTGWTKSMSRLGIACSQGAVIRHIPIMPPHQ